MPTLWKRFKKFLSWRDKNQLFKKTPFADNFRLTPYANVNDWKIQEPIMPLHTHTEKSKSNK